VRLSLKQVMKSSDGMHSDNLNSSRMVALWPTTRGSILASAIVAALLLLAIEVGLGWFHRYRFLRYMRDHPQTILLSPYQHQPTALAQFVWKFLRAAGTILALVLWACAVIFDCVVLGGVAAAWRYSQPYARAWWTRIRIKIDARKKPVPESQSDTAPPAVLVPILRAKAKTSATEPSSRQYSTSQNHHEERPKRSVTFAEHSNNQIRYTQVSYNPMSASETAPSSLSESRTPPLNHAQRTSSLESQQQYQQPKARIPNTPPLPRKRRSQQPLPLAEIKVNGPLTVAIQQRPSSADPGSVTAASPSRLAKPPHPPAFTSLSESIRKRRAVSSSSSISFSLCEFSPAVKRLYGRRRLPPQSLTQNIMYRHSPTSLANKLKRNREADRAVRELLDGIPTSGPNKKPATGATVAAGSQSANAVSGSAPSVPFQLGAVAAATSDVSTTGVQVPSQKQTPGAFQFGFSSVPATDSTFHGTQELSGEAATTPLTGVLQFGSTQPADHGPQTNLKFPSGVDSTPFLQPSTEATANVPPAKGSEEVAAPVFHFGSSLPNNGASTVLPIASNSVPLTSAEATSSTFDSAASTQPVFQFGLTPSTTAPATGPVDASPVHAVFPQGTSDKPSQASTDPVAPSLPMISFGTTGASETSAPAPKSGPAMSAPFHFGSTDQHQGATAAPAASVVQVGQFGSTPGKMTSAPAPFQFGAGSDQPSAATAGATPAVFQFGSTQTPFLKPPVASAAPAGAPTPTGFSFRVAGSDGQGANPSTPAFQVNSGTSTDSANLSQPFLFGTVPSIGSAVGGVRPRATAGRPRRSLQRRQR
jgi:hypothetical protein